MTAPTDEPAGVLVVRAWVEAGLLRARITQSLDLMTRTERVTTAATVDDVCTSVRGWLDELLARAGAIGQSQRDG